MTKIFSYEDSLDEEEMHILKLCFPLWHYTKAHCAGKHLDSITLFCDGGRCYTAIQTSKSELEERILKERNDSL